MPHYLRTPRSTPEEKIAYFRLPDLLAPGEVLAVAEGGHVLILDIQDGWPHVKAITWFSQQELRLVHGLFLHHPNYTPTEYLMAALQWSQPTEAQIVYYRKKYHEALASGGTEVLHRLPNVMSNTRKKLRRLGLSAFSLFETGYQLVPDRSAP